MGLISLQPQKKPGVSQLVEVGAEDGGGVVVTIGSLQPPQNPGDSQVVVVEVEVGDVMVTVGFGV